MEDKVKGQLNSFEGELKGTYYPLLGMDKATQQQLIDDHFLFKEGDRFLQAANACRYWPVGRGIFHNDNKTFLIWCNEEGMCVMRLLINFSNSFFHPFNRSFAYYFNAKRW